MNVYELVFHCPDMVAQEDAEIIRESLMNSPGVGDIDIDWKTKTVRVVTSNQDGGVDVRRHLIRSGFPPEE